MLFEKSKEHQALERRYQDLSNRVAEARWWMGSEFPDVAAATRWIQATHANYCGGKEEPVEDKPWIWSISDFREHMRQAASSKYKELNG